MNNQSLQLFQYAGKEIRTVVIDGEPHFAAVDVCAVLDVGNPSQALTRLDDDESTLISNEGREMNVITESGLYSLVLGSRKPEAKAFKRWITREVIPSIRRTGSYSATPALPQSYSDALRELAANVEAREAAESYAKQLETPANAWQVMVAASGDYSVEEAAKILSRDPDIEVGRNRLFTFMQSIGWIYRHGARNGWHAYQKDVDNGRLVLRMTAAFLNARTGEMENPAPTIRVTAKGIDALRRAWRSVEDLDGAA